MPAAPTRWLGVTAAAGRDHLHTPRLIGACAHLVSAYPMLSITINFFDAQPIKDPHRLLRGHLGSGGSRIEVVTIPGMKTLFWKRHLTAALTRHLEVVWLFDSDIAVHPAVFPLGSLAAVLQTTRATLLQPSIDGGTINNWLKSRQAHSSCVATTVPWVELQTPLWSGDAWAAYHDLLLSQLSDVDLAASDYGVDISWCAVARAVFPSRPACLMTPALVATHLNTHSIEASMNRSAVRQVRTCAGTCHSIQDRFQRFWRNFSHHTHACFGFDGRPSPEGPTQPLALLQQGQFALAPGGVARARQTLSNPDDGTSEAARDATYSLLGATSLHSRHAVRTRTLVRSLQALLGAMPTLKIVVNFNDGPGDGQPRAGAERDASDNARITTSWVPGSRVSFWHTVLAPKASLMKGVQYLWLFASTIALHPSVNPLPSFLGQMDAATASVSFAVTLPSTTEQPEASEPQCIARSSRRANMSTFVLLTRGAWQDFHELVASGGRMEAWESQSATSTAPWSPSAWRTHYGERLCEHGASIHEPRTWRTAFRFKRPGCLQIISPGVRLIDWRGYVDDERTELRALASWAADRRNESVRCAHSPLCATLTAMHRAAIHHADFVPLCWIHARDRAGIALDEPSRITLSRLTVERQKGRRKAAENQGASS